VTIDYSDITSPYIYSHTNTRQKTPVSRLNLECDRCTIFLESHHSDGGINSVNQQFDMDTSQ